MSALLLFGLVVVFVVFIFSFGVVTGMVFEGSLRPWRRSQLEAAVGRLLDAEAAVCNPRSGSGALLKYEEARARLARMVHWQPPVPAARPVVRQPARAASEAAPC